MKIDLNGEIISLPDENMTLEEFVAWRGIGPSGVAVAVNNRIVPRSKWGDSRFKEDDKVVIISAAYGG